MSLNKTFLPAIDPMSRALNNLSMSADAEFRRITERVTELESNEAPFFDSNYTASTAGVAFTTSASYTDMIAVTADVKVGIGDSYKAMAVVQVAAPNATATYALRLVAGASALYEASLLDGTTYHSHALVGVYKPADGELPVFKLQAKLTGGTGDLLRTSMGIFIERGYS